MKKIGIYVLIAVLLFAFVVFCSCRGEQSAQGELGEDGGAPIFREKNGWLEWKYENEEDAAWRQVYRLDSAANTEFDFVLNEDCESYSLVGIRNMTSATIEIPSAYNGKPVTKISSVAPMNYSGVKEVIIPDTVTEI